MPFQFGMPTLIELPDVQRNAQLCFQLGLRFVELNMNLPYCTPHALPPSRLKALRESAAIGLTLHLPEELDFASIHPAIRSGHVAAAAEAIRWAGQAGMELAVMHLSSGVYFTLPDRREFVYAHEAQAFRQRLLDGFNVVMQAANESSVRLCLENSGDWTVPFLHQAVAELLQRLPHLGLCWDVGHDESVGRANAPFFLAHRARIAHMHLHDADATSDHRPLFTGTVDISHKLDLARQLGLGVVIEVKTADALRQSVRMLEIPRRDQK